MIDVSPRLFRQLMERGEITPVRIPGVRRVLYDVSELRATVKRWKQTTSNAMAGPHAIDDLWLLTIGEIVTENELLKARVARLEADVEWSQPIVRAAVHALHKLTRERDRLRAELRELRREHREAA